MERKTVYGILGVVAVGTAALVGRWAYRCGTLQDQACAEWLASRGGSPSGQVLVENGTAVSPNNTLYPTTPSELLPLHSTLTDPDEGTIFDVVFHNGNQCIRLRQFKTNDFQDVWRAAKNLGPNQSQYQDHWLFDVYDPNLNFLGSFTTDIPPKQLYKFDVIQVATLVCEANEF